MPQVEAWSRFVALGDSFTEGVGDPEPSSPGGHRGWADRVAEVLDAGTGTLSYANLAVRGRLLHQIIVEQVEPALALGPDIITISGGGNDLLRPRVDPDALATEMEGAVARLRSGGATVVLFTGPDLGHTPVLGRVRTKVALYNENLRAIALRHSAVIADLWALTELRDPRMWLPDRIHLSATGHHTVARMVLRTLEVPNDLAPYLPEPLPAVSWRRARVGDLDWARQHLMPWVLRRVRHESSGDAITAKRPVFSAENRGD